MTSQVTSQHPTTNSDYAGLLLNTMYILECYGTIYNLLEKEKTEGGEASQAAVMDGNKVKTLSELERVVLNQNVLNPFAESAVISYDIPSDFIRAQILFLNISDVLIKSVDITQKRGRKLKRICRRFNPTYALGAALWWRTKALVGVIPI